MFQTREFFHERFQGHGLQPSIENTNVVHTWYSFLYVAQIMHASSALFEMRSSANWHTVNYLVMLMF